MFQCCGDGRPVAGITYIKVYNAIRLIADTTASDSRFDSQEIT